MKQNKEATKGERMSPNTEESPLLPGEKNITNIYQKNQTFNEIYSKN